MKFTLPIAAFVALAVASGSAHGQSNCDAYKHGLQNLQGYWTTNRHSVVEVIAGGNRGTAFLIDAEEGLFLTAGHVVGAPNTTLILRSEPSADRPEVSARVLAKQMDHGIDVALLKAADGQAFRNAPELDISFNDIDKWSGAGFLGASKSDTSTRLDARVATTVNNASDEYKHRYALTAPAEGGDSGAPVVLDGTSLVSGVVVDNESIYTAIVQPSVKLAEFLSRFAVEPTLEFEQLSALKTKEYFQTVPRKNYSNWRLLGYLKKLQRLLQTRSKVDRALIEPAGCTFAGIVHARHLGVDNILLAGEIMAKFAAADFRAIGTQMFTFAKVDDLVGSEPAKAALYREAARYFGLEINAKLAGATDTTPESGLFILSALGSEKLVAVTADGPKGNDLSALLLDYRVAMTLAAQLGDPVILAKDAVDRDKETGLASFVGTAVATTEYWKGLHFQEVANAYYQDGRYTEATGAFAAAWQNGVTKPSIYYGFNKSIVASGAPNLGGTASIDNFSATSSQDLLSSYRNGRT